MADVFLAYSRRNQRKAKQVARALSAAGFSVFQDTAIGPGQHWDQIIERELRAAKAVLVLWSKSAANSDYVREEARAGKDDKKLVPARIGACDLPYGFKAIQTADLRGWRGDKFHGQWATVLTAIEALARKK
jgi:hypothetical protein